jgi:parallel beta-helix repeat protein
MTSVPWLLVLGALVVPCVGAVCLAGTVANQPTARIGKVVSVGDIVAAESPTGGVQEAIDALGPDGGLVVIPPGVYTLRRSIVLASNVTLRGSGPATVLRRDAGAYSLLARNCPAKSNEVELRDTAGFEPGQEVAIRDVEQNGWGVLHAIVKEVKGKRLVLDRPTTDEYLMSREAAAIHGFPAFHGVEKTMFAIENLTIDGNLEKQPEDTPVDFTLSAVHLVRCTLARVRDVTVIGWPSDGIGVQGGGDVQVIGCTAKGCRGHGFHPGTSIKGAVFTGNVGHDNGRDGLYFCMRVKFITVSNNVFRGNGWNGIGGLGDAFDEWNVCTGNTCVENGRAGIDLSSGKNNVVSANVCVNNSQRVPGKYPGILIRDTTGSVIANNRASDDQEKPTQRTGIAETGKSDYNVITGNNLGGSAKAIEKVGQHTEVSGNRE